jgi:hypothetical protein
MTTDEAVTLRALMVSMAAFMNACADARIPLTPETSELLRDLTVATKAVLALLQAQESLN